MANRGTEKCVEGIPYPVEVEGGSPAGISAEEVQEIWRLVLN